MPFVDHKRVLSLGVAAFVVASMGWTSCTQAIRRPSQSPPWWAVSPAVDVDAQTETPAETPASATSEMAQDVTAEVSADSSRSDSLASTAASASITDSTRLPMAGPRIYGIGPIKRSAEPERPTVVELSDDERQRLRDAYAERSGEDRERVEQVNAYALWCLERDMWAEARTHLEQAIARDNLAASLHNNLGILYERLGESDQARLSYERALALQPGKTAYQSNLRRLDGAQVSRVQEEDRVRRRSEYGEDEEPDDLLRIMVHD